jgi:hypothetical protein
MSEDTDRAALDLVLRTLPTRRGVVLMVDEAGQIESGALGMTDDEVMMACWSIAVSIASSSPQGQEAFNKMLTESMGHTPTPRPRLYVPRSV